MSTKKVTMTRNRALSIALIAAMIITVMQPSFAMKSYAASAKMQKISMTKTYTVGATEITVSDKTVKIDAVSNIHSKLSYKVSSYPAGMKSYVSVSKKGVVKLKKNSKVGSYKIKVTAAAKGKYKAVSKMATIKVSEGTLSDGDSASKTYLANGEAFTDAVQTNLVEGNSSVSNDVSDNSDFGYQSADISEEFADYKVNMDNAMEESTSSGSAKFQTVLVDLTKKAGENLGGILAGGDSDFSTAATKYLVNLVVNSLLESAGVDTRSKEEVKLDQIIDKLNEIYAVVNDTNQKVTNLCNTVSLADYASAMNDRNEKIELLDQLTTDKYKYVIDTLGDGYDEYIDKYEMLQIFMNEENYVSKNGKDPVINQDFIDKCKKAFDNEFWTEYLYMTKATDTPYYGNDKYEANSLALYMAYKLQTKGGELQSVLDNWAGSGTSSAIAMTKSLLNSYAKGVYTSDGKTTKSYPEIYDAYVYKSYPWEHQGYELRKLMRAQDSLVLNEAYEMSELYCMLNASSNKSLEYERSSLEKLMSQYNQTLQDNPVVEHNDCYICQIPGCEYVVAKNLVFYDYRRGIYNVAGYDLTSGSSYDRYHDMAYDTNITYDYYKLNSDQKTQYTYWDHTALGDANNPIAVASKSVDLTGIADPVSTYTNAAYFDCFKAEGAYGSDSYLPMSAYRKMYEYYTARNGGSPVSIYAILQSVYGVSFPDHTWIVTDAVSSGKKYNSYHDYDYYKDIFHMYQTAAVTTDHDSAYVQTCLNDWADSTFDVEFTHSCNIHSNFFTGNTYFNRMGSTRENRFVGLGVLGKVKSSYITS